MSRSIGTAQIAPPGASPPSAASSALLYYRTDLTTGDATITFGGTSVAVEIINDSVANNVAINFTGAAAIPTSSTSLVANHLVLPKEARYFAVTATSAHVIASAASTTIRVTVFLL